MCRSVQFTGGPGTGGSPGKYSPRTVDVSTGERGQRNREEQFLVVTGVEVSTETQD